MMWQILAMYAVALVFALVGAGLLLALARPRSAGQVYAFRMIGIMALAGGLRKCRWARIAATGRRS